MLLEVAEAAEVLLGDTRVMFRTIQCAADQHYSECRALTWLHGDLPVLSPILAIFALTEVVTTHMHCSQRNRYRYFCTPGTGHLQTPREPAEQQMLWQNLTGR